MSGYNSEWEELAKREKREAAKKAKAKKQEAKRTDDSLTEEFELMSKESLFEMYTLARKKNETLESIVESQKNFIDLLIFKTEGKSKKVKAPKNGKRK